MRKHFTCIYTFAHCVCPLCLVRGSHPSGLPAAGLQGDRQQHHCVWEGAGQTHHGRGGDPLSQPEATHGHGETAAGAGGCSPKTFAHIHKSLAKRGPVYNKKKNLSYWLTFGYLFNYIFCRWRKVSVRRRNTLSACKRRVSGRRSVPPQHIKQITKRPNKDDKVFFVCQVM